MNLKFIKTDLIYAVKGWLRSKGTVFWTILFPILLIMIFGAIFSESGDVSYELVLQDLDGSDESGNFTTFLDETNIFELKNIEEDVDISDYMKEEDISVGLQIPDDFQMMIQQIKFNPMAKVNLTFYHDPSDNTVSPVVRSVLSGLINNYNDMITLSPSVVGMEVKSTLGEDFDFIDFFVPGMIGFTIMTSMVYGSIERNTKLRKDGILRKLLTMPVTRSEWILSKMLFMLFLSFISTFVVIAVGMLVWGLNIQINIFFFIIVICTSFMFSGLGMIVGRFVKEEETADMAGGAITFPMMFLAGTFFPLEQMPEFLQSVAQILPLYYVNEGLRNAMIYLDMDKTLFFTGFVVTFALAFFIVGVLLQKWKED